jgi:hypothetical protein
MLAEITKNSVGKSCCKNSLYLHSFSPWRKDDAVILFMNQPSCVDHGTRLLEEHYTFMLQNILATCSHTPANIDRASTSGTEIRNTKREERKL